MIFNGWVFQSNGLCDDPENENTGPVTFSGLLVTERKMKIFVTIPT